MAFYKGLVKQQDDYFKRYDTETLTITKFSYMLSNLPADEFFNNDDNIFRMRLWLQFEKILTEQGEREYPELRQDFQDNKYQLSDIQFAKNNFKEGPIIASYIQNSEELEQQEARLSKFVEEYREDDITKTKKNIEVLHVKMDKDKEKMKKMKGTDNKS